MNDTKKSPGRPRMYETNSSRLGAFRDRQGDAGYLRREVLVTRDTAERIAGLAKEQGVPVVDVTSALLEHGLRMYEAASPSQIAQLGGAGASMLSAPVAAPAKPASGSAAGPSPVAPPALDSGSSATSPTANPIANFFTKRKESLNGR